MSSTVFPRGEPTRVAAAMPRFVGRAWILPKILHWWDSSNERTALLVGEPGTGKSCLAAWLSGLGPSPDDVNGRANLARVRSLVKGTYFCQATASGALPSSFADSIANQLLHTVPPFAAALTACLDNQIRINASATVHKADAGSSIRLVSINQLNLSGLGEEYAFDLALAKPLLRLKDEGAVQQMLLVIDALDEGFASSNAGLVRLLARLESLPRGVRLLVTTREDPRVLKHLRAKPIIRLSIDPSSGADARVQAADIESYAIQRLKPLRTSAPADVVQFAKLLVRRSGGAFLYAAELIDSLEHRGEADGWQDLGSVVIPESLSGMYSTFLNRELGVHEGSWFSSYEPVLGLLAVSRGDGLSSHLLGALAGCDVRSALRQCKQYLLGSFPDGPFRIFHKSFSDFLLEDENNVDYHIDGSSMHQRIADHFWKSHPADWNACDDYGIQHIVVHLAAAGQAERLSALVDDAWMRVRFDRGSQRNEGFLLDLAIVWEYELARVLDASTSNASRMQAIVTAAKAAFARTSIYALSKRFVPALTARAIETKTWTAERALNEIAHYRSQELRGRLILILLDVQRVNIAPDTKTRAVKDFHSAIDTLADETKSELQKQFAVLSSPDAEGDESMDEQEGGAGASADALAEQSTVLDQIDAMDIDWDAYLHGPHVVARQEELLDEERASALVEIAGRLDPSLIARALEIAGQIQDDDQRNRALSAIAPKIGSGDLAPILTPTSFGDQTDVANALVALCKCLSAVLRAPLVARVARLARSMKDPHERCSHLIEAARLMEPHDKESVLLEALQAAPRFGLDRVLWSVREDLTDHIRKEMQERVDSLESYEYHWAQAALLVDAEPEAAAHHLYNSTSDHDAGTQYIIDYVGSRLSCERREDLLNDALKGTRYRDVLRALHALSPILSQEELKAALASARVRFTSEIETLGQDPDGPFEDVDPDAAPMREGDAESAPVHAELTTFDTIQLLTSAAEKEDRSALLELFASGVFAPPRITEEAVQGIATAIADVALNWHWPEPS